MKNFFPVAFLLLASSILAAEPAYAQVNLGSSSSATNPERSGDATTGLFSSTTGAVSISSAGTEMMRVNGTGVGIGTLSPPSLLTVNKNTSGVPTPSGSATNLQIVGANSAFSDLEMDAFGDNSSLLFVRSDGTFSSPSALASGEPIGSFVASGYNGSSIATNKGGMAFSAGGTWSTTSTPTYITFTTTSVGSTTKSERMRIDTTGNVGIGTTSPGNPLSVNGVIESQSGGVKFPDGTMQTTAGTSTASTGMVLLATVNASAASSVIFGSTYITSAYNKYVIEFDGYLVPSESSQCSFSLQISTNNGSSWLTSGYSTIYLTGSTNTTQSTTFVDLFGGGGCVTGSTPPTAQGTIKFSNPSTSSQLKLDFDISGYAYAGYGLWVGSATNSSTTAINAIKLFDGTGSNNITGNFHLYGLTGI